MKQFDYTITDPIGIHARPAGMLVKEAKAFADTAVTVTKNGITVKATQLMKLMSLGVKQGDTVTVAAEGAGEEAAIAARTEFFHKNL
jgi:phosphocarrier protein